MTRMHWHVVTLALALPAVACGQGLAGRVQGAPDGPVSFTFSARSGTCGNGKTYFRVDDGSWHGSWSDGMPGDPCTPGPVRVVLQRAGKEIVKVETYVGPVAADSIRTLGAVPAREAAAYLMQLASKLDGRPAREAMLPAVLADSAAVTPALMSLAKDADRSREVRRSAISWLYRRRGEPGGVGASAIDRQLDQIVRDRNETESVRQSALGTVGRGDAAEGVAALITYAGSDDAWLARKAFGMLANGGDPRARAFIRSQVMRGDLAEEQRVEAIHGLGSEYGTGADIALLRDLYPKLNSDRERDAVISTVSNAGGRANVDWLLDLAKAPTETVQRRRRVLSQLGRVDDPRVKEALKAMVER
ncbi:MAG: hypothetical protein HY275_06905 [Gemmatimonadetes bacterium]|nr:hypothetical protein [Gemmatimonadota bacterium]